MKQPKKQGPKVARMLRELAPQERTALIDKMKVSRATFYRWCNEPGGMSVNEAEKVRLYLGELHGRKFNLLDLWKEPTSEGGEKGRQRAAA